jgi:hypothetical protein
MKYVAIHGWMMLTVTYVHTRTTVGLDLLVIIYIDLLIIIQGDSILRSRLYIFLLVLITMHH